MLTEGGAGRDTQGFFQGPERASHGSLKKAAGGGRFRKSSTAHSPLPWRDREGEEQRGGERKKRKERERELEREREREREREAERARSLAPSSR